MFEWGPSADALFGAAVAGIIALLAVHFERRAAQKARRTEKLDRQSSLAFSVQAKIAQAYGWSHSVNKAISECFSGFAHDQGADVDPGVKVQPLVGMTAPDLSFKADELALLLETGDQGLVEKLLSLQWEIATSAALVSAFNVSRHEYSRFVADRATTGEFIDGEIAKITLPMEQKHAVETRVAELNRMVNDMLDTFPKNARECALSLRRIDTALQEIDGITIREVRVPEEEN